MSKRADYDCLGKEYDNDRIAAGSDVMCALMQFYSGKPLKCLHVLDAGCGTGNYAKALINHGVKHVTLLDASPGMLNVAKEKLANEIKAETIQDIVEVSMPPLPFPDACFDAAMFNTVLNHLDKAGDDDFPACLETLKEAKRVIRPGGLVIISAVLNSTTKKVWTMNLDKTFIDRRLQGSPSLEKLEEMFHAADISCIQKMNILGSDMFPNYFKDPERFLDHTLHYLNATDLEKVVAHQRLLELKQSGELMNWIKKNDIANTAGLLTILVCKKTEL